MFCSEQPERLSVAAQVSPATPASDSPYPVFSTTVTPALAPNPAAAIPKVTTSGERKSLYRAKKHLKSLSHVQTFTFFDSEDYDAKQDGDNKHE